MVEQAGGIEENFEEDHGQSGRTNGDNSNYLDPHGEKNLNGMKADSGGDIEVEVGVVNAVEPPEQGDEMEYGVLKVDDKIESCNPDEKFQPVREREVVKQPPTAILSQERHPHSLDREEDSQGKGVNQDQPEVAIPSKSLGGVQVTSGRKKLPGRHGDQDDQKEGESNHAFMS